MDYGTRANFLQGIILFWRNPKDCIPFSIIGSGIFSIIKDLHCSASSATTYWPIIYLVLFIYIPRAFITSDFDDYCFMASMASVSSVPPVALQPWPSSHLSRFDSDSFPVGIDNQASRCISYNKAHFEDLHLNDCGQCRGFDGTSIPIKGSGTLVFTIQDD